MSRIYDQPNHPQYGPVRRCWVMMSGLFRDLDAIDDLYYQEWGWRWDDQLAYRISKGVTEMTALRTVLWRMLASLAE